MHSINTWGVTIREISAPITERENIQKISDECKWFVKTIDIIQWISLYNDCDVKQYTMIKLLN